MLKSVAYGSDASPDRLSSPGFLGRLEQAFRTETKLSIWQSKLK